jgi:penicillin-binding protein 1B
MAAKPPSKTKTKPVTKPRVQVKRSRTQSRLDHSQSKKSASNQSDSRSWRYSFKRYLMGFIALSLIAFSAYLYFLNHLINQRFDGDTWALPSRIYARPLELYSGMSLSRESLKFELELSTYQRVSYRPKPGQFRLLNDSIVLYTQDFEYSDSIEPGRLINVDYRPLSLAVITPKMAKIVCY